MTASTKGCTPFFLKAEPHRTGINSILQVTRLIEISRAYESMARTIENSAELSRRSVERLGRIA